MQTISTPGVKAGKQSRITARCCANHATAENHQSEQGEAATLMGTATSGFVRSAAKEKAREIIDQETRLTLTRRDFDAFSAALNRNFVPNQTLKEALATARRTVKRA